MTKKKTSPKFKSYTIPVEIYNKSVELIIADEVDQVIRMLDERYDLEYDESAGYYAITLTYSTKNDGTHFYIVLPSNDLNAGTLVHEAYHATMRILELVSVPLKFANQEPYAYLLEYITREALKHIESFKVVQKRQQKLRTKTKKKA